MSHVRKLIKKGKITPPKFLESNLHFEVIMGSYAYGVSNETSDMDIYGWCIPPKDVIFPHINGYIQGFGKQPIKFDQYQQHHIFEPSLMGGKGRTYDISIYNIVKYFQLCMDNNPNMIDSMFVARDAVLHITHIGELVRASRKDFLHKGCWHKFKGYAYSQMCKIRNKTNAQNPARAETIKKHGYDVKFAYHVVRLLNEVEMILIEGDLDLRRNKEQLKSIRRGEWTIEDIMIYFNTKEADLEKLYLSSKLPYKADEEKIKQLLLNCLEHHYGTLESFLSVKNKYEIAVKEINEILYKLNI